MPKLLLDNFNAINPTKHFDKIIINSSITQLWTTGT